MKYLLCRPLGGLNDSLCQIQRSKAMANVSGRELIVQTETGSPGLPHRFGEEIGSVFTISNSHSFHSASFQHSLKSAQIFPEEFSFLASAPSSSLEERTKGSKVIRRLKYWELFKRAPILVHEAYGGGLSSASLLPRVLVSKRIETALTLANDLIPVNSVAIHFRSSDYQTDERLLFDAVTRVGSRPVLLASDSDQIIIKVRSHFPELSIISVPEILANVWPTYRPIERAVIELFAIAGCKDFIPLRLGLGKSDLPAFSGFTRLAKHIWAVTHISNYGLFSWVSSISPLAGIGGHKSKVANSLCLAVIGIPRLLWQSAFLRGVFNQVHRR